MTVEADLQPPGRQPRHRRSASATRRSTTSETYTVATNDFLARGGDGYTCSRDASRLLPDADAPLLANEVMGYIRRLGTLSTGVEGRIVLKQHASIRPRQRGILRHPPLEGEGREALSEARCERVG